MEGGIKSFSPSLRIAAGKELIGYAFPIFAPPRRRTTRPATDSDQQSAPRPTPRAQTATDTAAPQFTYPPAGVPLGMSRERAEELYQARFCREGDTIEDSILRRSMDKFDDMESQQAEARRLWEEKERYIQKRCPGLTPQPYPRWFDGLMDIVHSAPEDPRDWWTEEDWEMCEMGLCDDGDDDWPCPCSTVPRNRGDP